MSVHIENLAIGDWVAPYEDKQADYGNPFSRPMEFDGLPWKVVAFSAPFVALERRERVVTVDIRAIGLTKLSPKYIRTMRDIDAAPSDQSRRTSGRKRKRREKRDPRDCPRCGQRMVQRIPNGSAKRQWHRVCPDCGYDQGPVEQGAMP